MDSLIACARGANAYLAQRGVHQEIFHTIMDWSAAHEQYPLDLERCRDAMVEESPHFAHDVMGIARHMIREGENAEPFPLLCASICFAGMTYTGLKGNLTELRFGASFDEYNELRARVKAERIEFMRAYPDADPSYFAQQFGVRREVILEMKRQMKRQMGQPYKKPKKPPSYEPEGLWFMEMMSRYWRISG